MTKEEKIKGLYNLKEYLVENPIELEGYKSLPITLIDYAIESLEQEPKTGHWVDDEVDSFSKSFGYKKFHCSRCLKVIEGKSAKKTDYCPCCGSYNGGASNGCEREET